MPKKKSRIRSTASAGRSAIRRGSGNDGESAAQAIGSRLRQLRIERKMSQGEIEMRTGLLRCYVSRVEGGYTVPSVDTLEKFAAALAVPLHGLFVRGKEAPLQPISQLGPRREPTPDAFFEKLRRLVRKMDEQDRDTFLSLVRKLAVLGD